MLGRVRVHEKVQGSEEGVGGTLGHGRVRFSGDQKRAALRGHAHADPGMVQFMPMSASTSISQLRAPHEMRFALLCAKFKILQLC